MRISGFEKFTLSQTRLSQIQGYTHEVKSKIDTGKDFQKISQNPVKANAVMLVNTGIAQIEQYQSNLTDLKGYVQTAESYLAMGVDVYQRAMELAVQGANGTYSENDRKSFKIELEQLINHMVSIGNSTHLGNYLFAGKADNVQPLQYDGATVTYNGSDEVNTIRVSSALELSVSVTAEDSLLETINGMIKLRDALASGASPDIETAMNDLKQAGETLFNSRSEMGVRIKSAEMIEDSYEKNKLDMQTKKSNLEDADMAEAIMQFMQAQHLYEGAIQATLKMYENSLLKYI